jgi:hypothetical protein
VPFYAEPRRSYIHDQDADGAFVLRNENRDEDAMITSEYVYVHYKARPVRHYADARVVIDGRWTVEPQENYVMTYDDSDQSYNAVVLQKLGYYNYQLLLCDLDGTTHTLPEEGSFYQTENRYEAFVYYRQVGGRSWRLVGFCCMLSQRPESLQQGYGKQRYPGFGSKDRESYRNQGIQSS